MCDISNKALVMNMDRKKRKRRGVVINIYHSGVKVEGKVPRHCSGDRA